MRYSLGIDCGTQSSKAIIIDVMNGQVLASSSSPHTMYTNELGAREQDPSIWIAAIKQSISDVIEKANIDPQKIQSIGVSGQQHGLVVLDENDQVIRNAKLWCDTETVAENNQFITSIGGAEGAFQHLGLSIEPGYTASKIWWLKEHEPEHYNKIRKILLPHDYINYWLTGNHCCEYGDASGTGLFNIETRQWSEYACNKIDESGFLNDKLPNIVTPFEPIGLVKPEICDFFGFSDSVAVSVGGGDNMMGAIGTGNIENGIVTLSLGTSGTIYTHSTDYINFKSPSIANFCSSTDGWLPLICTMNVTSATTSVLNCLNRDITDFSSALSNTTIGASGISVYPFFNGERVPSLPNAHASISGLTSDNFTANNLIRATVEGITYVLKLGADILFNSGIECNQIRVIGGGANSKEWRQIVADIFDTEVVTLKNEEAAALGAAIQSSWLIFPNIDRADIINKFVIIDDDNTVKPSRMNVELYNNELEKFALGLDKRYLTK